MTIIKTVKLGWEVNTPALLTEVLANQGSGITILSFGAGQDSTAILYKLVYDPQFAKKYLNGELHIVMSDTGNEFPETYQHLVQIASFCDTHGIPFAFLTENETYRKCHWAKFGYHGKTWSSLQTQYETNNCIMSVALPRTCTDNLKIQPFYRYIAQLLSDRYGYDPLRKKCFSQYHEEYGKLRILIGFANGEQDRVASPPKQHIEQLSLFGNKKKAAKSYIPAYRTKHVEQLYPLIDLGIDRQGCQTIISGYERKVPPPSNCIMCPFAGDIELLYVARFHPKEWEQWVQYEQNKLNKFADRERNLGVKGKQTLPEAIQIAQHKYGHLTDEQVREYRFSHGHCVKSKY